eukprot:969936_1
MATTKIMLVFIISYIYTIIIPLYAHDEQIDDEIGVCQPCTDDSDCPSKGTGLESCQNLGGIDICYWDQSDIIDVGAPFTRECKSDYDCARFLEENDDLEHLGSFKINKCLRCCFNDDVNKDLCSETVSELESGGEMCGTFMYENANNAQINSYGFNMAPCCPGEVCIDNVLGICGTYHKECEACISWNTQQVDFEDTINILDNCEDGLFCLHDGPQSTDVSLNELSYLSYGNHYTDLYAGNPDWIYGDTYSSSIHFHNLRPHVTVKKGICVPDDGISKKVDSCETDDNCPVCMRCCAINNNSHKKCVRSSGNICGLKFAERGPCCCPEYTCKGNQCITESPTASPSNLPTPSPSNLPSKSPTASTNLPSKSPTNDDDDDQKYFGAAANNNKNDNINDNGEYVKLNDKIITTILINLWAIALAIIITLIILAYCCLYKKQGQASFKSDVDDHEMNQNV